MAAADDKGRDVAEMLEPLGAPKKEIRLASFLGFFKSDVEAVRGSALRFSILVWPEEQAWKWESKAVDNGQCCKRG